MDWEKRRKIDFWLLAGMIGIWVYWLLLYRPGLLDYSALKSYLWLFWRNNVPVLFLCVVFAIAFWCFRKGKRVFGVTVLLLTAVMGYWAYGPDFPKVPPLKSPKVLWQQLPSRIPVMLIISYDYQGELPPLPFLKLQSWLYSQKVGVAEEAIANLQGQARKALVELAQKAGEDAQLFEKCLNIAIRYFSRTASGLVLPLFAEKRYENVTGQLCWVFGFMELRKEKVSSFRLLSPSFEQWIAVRLRFPQKAWLTYLAIEPHITFRHLLLTLAIIAGYGVFLVGLRYVYDRWF